MLKRAWAVAVLLLLAATWKLWIKQSDFPSVPLFAIPSSLHSIESLAVIALVMVLVAIACGVRRRACFALVVVCFAILFSFDQHRLQPWAYQAWLYGIVLAAFSRSATLAWMRYLTMSIYFFSALGKCDFQFLHTVGQDFVSIVLGNRDEAPGQFRLAIAALLPVTEMSIAVGLCIPRLRRFAGLGAMAMHASLVLLLGPWLLGHSLGVLLWNGLLFLQAWHLFVRKPEELYEETPIRVSAIVTKIVLIAAMLLPLGERLGYWDHWLSWSLYAPHTSRVEIELHESVLDSLPTSAKTFVSADENADGWYELSIDRWSLQTLYVPVYPQARFQLGVAVAVAQLLGDPDGIRVRVKSVADRITGERVEVWLRGRVELEEAAEHYYFLPAE